MANPWFLSSTPVLDQLGATFGGSGGGYDADYTALIQNQIEQAQANADRDYGLKKQQLDQQYALAKMSARSQQERNQIDAKYQRAQVQLAQDRLAQDAQQFNQTLGQRQHEFDIGQGNNVRDYGEGVRRFDLGFGEGQRQFNTTTGYNLLNMQANLRGPANYFQAANFARGVANDPNSGTFLNALRNNTHLAGFSGQTGVPDAVSLNSLAGQQGNGTPVGTGTGAATAPNAGGAPAAAPSQYAAPGGPSADDAYLKQIYGIYGAGAHKLAPGALERMTQTERSLLGSGIDAIGGDTSTFLDQYRRSRINQGIGASRAA